MWSPCRVRASALTGLPDQGQVVLIGVISQASRSEIGYGQLEFGAAAGLDVRGDAQGVPTPVRDSAMRFAAAGDQRTAGGADDDKMYVGCRHTAGWLHRQCSADGRAGLTPDASGLDRHARRSRRNVQIGSAKESLRGRALLAGHWPGEARAGEAKIRLAVLIRIARHSEGRPSVRVRADVRMAPGVVVQVHAGAEGRFEIG